MVSYTMWIRTPSVLGNGGSNPSETTKRCSLKFCKNINFAWEVSPSGVKNNVS